MKKLFSAAFLSTFIFLQAFSQQDFQKGYVVLNNQDTISGLVNYGSNYQNTLKCLFKTDHQSPVRVFTPDDILAYRFIDGKYFISKKIKPDTTKIFIEFIFDGIVNLYDYFDKSGVHYLISKSDDEFIELKNNINKTVIDGVEYEKESKEYIGTLKLLFKDSLKASKKAENSSLSLNPLIDLSEEYHREVCSSEECITYAKKKIHLRLSYGFVAGVSSSGISIEETRRITDRFILPDNGTGLIIGAFVNLSDPFISRRLGIQSMVTASFNKYSTDDSKLDLKTLNIPLQVKYSLPFKNFQISGLGGFRYNRILAFDYMSDEYGNYTFTGGRSQTGFVGGLEFSYNVNAKSNIFTQLKYSTISGKGHKGQWSDIPYIGDENDNRFNMKTPAIEFLIGYTF